MLITINFFSDDKIILSLLVTFGDNFFISSPKVVTKIVFAEPCIFLCSLSYFVSVIFVMLPLHGVKNPNNLDVPWTNLYLALTFFFHFSFTKFGPTVLRFFIFLCNYAKLYSIANLQLLLGYLPASRDLWEKELAENRAKYAKLKEELLLSPVRRFWPWNLSHSKWTVFYGCSILLATYLYKNVRCSSISVATNHALI